MKVYIATDLEGISGITVWEQTRDRTTALYQEGRHLLTAEVNAAVQGALDRVPDARPYTIDCPITARLQFPRREIADAASCPRSTRIDALTFERVIDSPLDIRRF